MTQVGEGVAVGGGRDPDIDDLDDNHWLELEYRFQSGRAVYGYFRATDSDGMVWVGRLNDQGQVCLAGLPPGNVRVTLLPEPDLDARIEATRASIKEVLDQIIEDQRLEAEAYERELEQMGGPQRVFEHIQAVGRGAWNGAVGFVEFVGKTAYKVAEFSYYLSPANLLGDTLRASYQSYQDGELTWSEWYDSVNQNLQDEQKKDLARLFGVEPDDICEERLRELMGLIAEAYDIAAFITDDAPTREMLLEFAQAMADNQSSVEWAEFAGAGVFEIVLAALLALFTAGAGNAAQAASQLRHASRLRGLGHLFRNLARQLRRKKLRKEFDAPVDQKTSLSTEQPQAPQLTARAELPYEPHSDVKAPKTGDRVHKRYHRDGNPEDPYTLQADGKPMGAETGPMPNHLTGLEAPPAGHDDLVAQGWPNLNYDGYETYDTFVDAKPVDIPEGTKIYRIVDEKNNDAGGFWAYDLPANKTEWRRGYAVKDDWNDNGYYVEHFVGEGGLKAWEGPAAGQPYEEFSGNEFYLQGGSTQLFVSPNSIEASSPNLTNWPEP